MKTARKQAKATAFTEEVSSSVAQNALGTAKTAPS
jgi:hypothetical protein